jgi:hypothetical protein
MTTRLTLAAWVAMLIALWALALGNRPAFVAAILTAAAMWVWRCAIKQRQDTEPDPPRGVYLIHPDGSETTCELAYQGVDEHGLHEWQVTTRMHAGDELRCAVLPDHTTLTVPVADDVRGAWQDGDGYRMEGT